MKKVIILLMTIMGTLQLQAQDKDFWIFLCFGQSNMAGQAPIEAQDLQVSDRYLSMATTDGADRTLDQWRKEVRKIYRDLPKEKLVFVFQSADGRATTDVDLK